MQDEKLPCKKVFGTQINKEKDRSGTDQIRQKGGHSDTD